MSNEQITSVPSRKTIIAGRVISILVIIFFLLDAIMKVIKEKHAIDGSLGLGWPMELIQPIGFVLLFFTILYAIPRTATLGAVLLSVYLGGAVAVMMKAGVPFFFTIFFAILVWAGLWLRSASVRKAFTSL